MHENMKIKADKWKKVIDFRYGGAKGMLITHVMEITFLKYVLITGKMPIPGLKLFYVFYRNEIKNSHCTK